MQSGTLQVYSNAMFAQVLAEPGARFPLDEHQGRTTMTPSITRSTWPSSPWGSGSRSGSPRPSGGSSRWKVLHDLGKIASPWKFCANRADEDEWRVMRRDPSWGADLLARMPGSNRLPMIVAFEHYMRHDGRGYPFIRKTGLSTR
jgi:hypothetical protein